MHWQPTTPQVILHTKNGKTRRQLVMLAVCPSQLGRPNLFCFSSTHSHLYLYLAPLDVAFLTFFAYRQELDHLSAVVLQRRTPSERQLRLRWHRYTRYGQLWAVKCLRDVQETKNQMRRNQAYVFALYQSIHQLHMDQADQSP
jgi:hypothetical protein